jgi:hypothetical protein
MNLRILALLPLASVLAHANDTVILERDFENPTETTYHYPNIGTQRYGRHENIGAWALNGGVISLTYGGGLGADKSGGLLASVVETPDTFMAVNAFDLTLPFNNLDTFKAADAHALRVEFHANIPAGRELIVYFGPTMPEDMKSREWASRLVFGKVRGTGSYTRYVLEGQKAEARSIEQFSQFVRDAALNGMTAVKGALVFNLPATAWTKGESFQLDNVLFKMSR